MRLLLCLSKPSCGLGAIVLACQLAVAAPLVTEAGKTVIPFDTGGKPTGLWTNGALVTIDDGNPAAPMVKVVDKGGKILNQFTFTIPKASRIIVQSGRFARGSDGAIALAGSAYTDDSRGTTFVAWVSADGKHQTVIRTMLFITEALTVGPDGSVWVAGREIDEGKGEKQEYDVLRRYDRTGKMLGSFIPRSSLTVKPGALPPADYSWLIASNDRVGWYSPIAHTYVVFSADGALATRLSNVEIASKTLFNGAALCDDGRLFVSARIGNSTTGTSALFVLNREDGKWSGVPHNEKQWIMLYGCDGTALASRTENSSITWLNVSR